LKQEYQPPEETLAERLDHAFRTVLNIAKGDLLKEETRIKRSKERKE
jgi:hypothetical protein